MKMKKIFKTLSILLVAIIIMLASSCQTSCFNKATTFPNGLDISVSSTLKEYLLYPEEAPVLHFDYDGVKAMYDVDGAACFFVQNDQYALSDHFAAHLSQYSAEDICIIACEDQTVDKGKANFGGERLTLDEVDEEGNPQTYSKEYQIVACKDGTRYSYQYRTFVSEGKRYYIFRYSSNMGISLEQSFAVVKVDGANKLVLVPLPYDTKYEVAGNSLSVDALIKKDTYIDEKYSKYAYPSFLDELEEKDKQEAIRNWYRKYTTVEEGDDFIIHYLGGTFKLSFGYTDCGNTRDQKGFKVEVILP